MLWLCIIFMLLIKIHLLQKSAREIERAFSEKLITLSLIHILNPVFL